MTWTKYIFVLILVVMFSIVAIFVSDFVAKKHLGLGEPIVYDPHPLWGYTPRANRQYSRFDGDIVTINDIGARSRQSWNMEGKNIVFLGDSVTYGGSYIDDDQTFVSISCSKIEGWSCHNAGVNAYGILNMVARSRYDERVNTSAVRVFTFISGDFDRGLRDSNTAHFILRNPPENLSGLWEILNFVASSITPKAWFGKKSDIKEENQVDQKRLVSRQFALDVLVNELERLESVGMIFLLVHSPSRAEIENHDLITSNRVLTDLKLRFQGHFHSLHTVLSEEYESNNQNIFKDSVHFEERGHRVVGEYLFPFISEQLSEFDNL